jgi:hypothetical protein
VIAAELVEGEADRYQGQADGQWRALQGDHDDAPFPARQKLTQEVTDRFDRHARAVEHDPRQIRRASWPNRAAARDNEFRDRTTAASTLYVQCQRCRSSRSSKRTSASAPSPCARGTTRQ